MQHILIQGIAEVSHLALLSLPESRCICGLHFRRRAVQDPIWHAGLRFHWQQHLQPQRRGSTIPSLRCGGRPAHVLHLTLLRLSGCIQWVRSGYCQGD